MSSSLRAGSLPVLMFLLIGLMGCERTPPEQRLRESVQALQASVEDRDAAATADWLADDFVGPDGMDREGLRGLARLAYLRHREIGISLGPMRVALQDRHATVEFTAMVTGGQGGLLPERGRIYEVETGWRLESGDWKLTSAQWQAGTE